MSTAIRRRILMVIPRGYHQDICGRQFADLAVRLKREGNHVSFHLATPWLRPARESNPLTEIPRFLPGQWFSLRDLYQAVAQHDVIHLVAIPPQSLTQSLTPALVLAKFQGKQIIVSFAGGSVEDLTGSFARVLLPALRLVHRITTPTEYSARLLERYNLPVAPVPCAIDLVRHTPRLIQEVQPRILAVMLAGPASNTTSLLRAFILTKRKYPRTELTLVGASDRLRLAEPVLQREGGVTLIDSTRAEDLQAAWANCDVLINNATDDELPVPILHALAQGIPTISCDAGGIRQVIQDGHTGLIFPSNDFCALSDRLIDLIERPSLAARLSRLGPTEASRFSWPTLRSRWIALFNR